MDYEKKNYEKESPAGVYAEPVLDDTILRKRNRWEVDHHASSFAPGSHWSNADFDPTPVKHRTWDSYNFAIYWASDSWAVSEWELGSTMVASGLSGRLSIVAIAIGKLIISTLIAYNGRIGSRLHIPFPVITRASWGFWGAYFVIVSRWILGIFWLGVTAVQGGQAVNVFLNALWPSFRTLHNGLPASAAITSAGLVSYFIYFCIQVPFLCIPYYKIRWFFLLKSIICPICFFAITGATVHAAGGDLSNTTVFSPKQALSGSLLGWTFVNCVNSAIGNYATLGVNIADFSRYAKKPSANYIQIVLIPFFFVIVGSLGIVTAAASQKAYGTLIWNPIMIPDYWRTSGGRAASAFVSLGLILACLGINVSANSISAANDLVALFPKYVNIRRGQLISAVIGCWALVPWEILVNATRFLSFMSGYTVFLGPLTAIMMVDYYIVAKTKLNLPELYRPDGIYNYGNAWGTNYRAVLAFLCGSIPCVPGLINYINPSIKVNTGCVHLFAIGYLFSFLTASFVYIGLSWIHPPTIRLVEQETLGEDILARHPDQVVDGEAALGGAKVPGKVE